MKIFSYIDVLHRAFDLLKRINSKGYDIYSRQHVYKNMFEVYVKSQQMGQKFKTFNDKDIISQEIKKICPRFIL